MSNYGLIPICICFSVLLPGTLAGANPEPTQMPQPVKTSLPPTRQLSGSYFGINGSKFFHVPGQRETAIQQRLEWMRTLGIRWDRCDLWWHVVEPQPGTWDFSRPDLVFDALERADVQWYPILCYGAAWFTGGRTAPQSEAEYSAFAAYVQKTVHRYRNRAPMWSVWNEPNISEFWNPEPDAAAYARLLKAAYSAIKSTDPDALVAAPAIAPLGPWDRGFVEALYRNDFQEHYDVFDYHYYRNTAPEDEVPAEIAEIQAVLRRHGDVKPIIVSESGVSTLALLAQGLSAEAADQRQAALVVRNQLLCLALGIERFLYFDLQNWSDDQPHEWGSQLGLVTAAGEPKPAFYALRTLVSLVDQRRFVGRCHDLGDGIEGVLLHDDRTKRYILALWSTLDKAQTIDVALDADKAWLVEPLGQRKALNSAQNEHDRITIDQHPRYVIGVDRDVYCGDAGLAFAARHVIVAPGETLPLTVSRAPELSDGEWRAVTIDAPTGVIWAPSRGLLSVTSEVATGRYSLTAQLARVNDSGETKPEIARQVLIEVIAKVDVSFQLDGTTKPPTALIRIENRTEQPLTAPLRLIDSLTQNTVCTFESITVPTRRVHEVRYPLAERYFEAVDGVAAWRVAYGASQSPALGVMSLKQQLPLKPVIDGDLEEWQARPAIVLNDVEQVFHSPQPWRAPDASGRFWLEFADKSLVLAASVRDDDPLFNDVSPGEMWQADSVEFFLGMCGPTTRGVIKSGCEYHIGIAPTTQNQQPAAVWFHADRLLSRATIAVKRTRAGYDLEAAIPYDALDLDFEAGGEPRLLGLSVNLNDRDADDFAPVGVRPGLRLSWSGSPSNWINPERYGVVVLR